jgi:hypothetical protein
MKQCSELILQIHNLAVHLVCPMWKRDQTKKVLKKTNDYQSLQRNKEDFLDFLMGFFSYDCGQIVHFLICRDNVDRLNLLSNYRALEWIVVLSCQFCPAYLEFQ